MTSEMSRMSFELMRHSVDQSMSQDRKVIGYKTKTISDPICEDELVKNMIMEICYGATNTNPNHIYITINVCSDGYNKYELCPYIDSDCSARFEKKCLFLEVTWRKAKNPLPIRVANNSIMSHYKAIKGLSIEIGGAQCIIPILWVTDQPSHDVIIGNNFQMLYSPYTHTINQILFIMNGHLVPIDKSNKAYTDQKTEFICNQLDEKVIAAQREIILTISLLELSMKEQISEQ